MNRWRFESQPGFGIAGESRIAGPESLAIRESRSAVNRVILESRIAAQNRGAQMNRVIQNRGAQVNRGAQMNRRMEEREWRSE